MNCYEIGKNTIHEDMYDLLLDEELKTTNIGHYDAIYMAVKKYMKTCGYIKKCDIDSDNHNDRTQYIIDKLDNDNEECVINTIMTYSSSKYVYEIVYDHGCDVEDNMNQFCSMININSDLVCGKAYVIKTKMLGDGKFENCKMDIDDLVEIYMSLYYNVGLMVDDGTVEEIVFNCNEPRMVIGGTFVNIQKYELFETQFVIYYEDGGKKINKDIDELFNTEICGRVFVIMSSPFYRKKIWNMSCDMLDILKKNKGLEDVINKRCDKKHNPFIYFKI
jgi:predicted nucleic-acid-binding protein